MKTISSLLAATVLLGVSNLALADGPPISLQLNVGTAPVYLPPAYPPMAAPPVMVWLPQFHAYAALGAPQPIFYLGQSYYYYYGNRWYAGPGYSGPWRPVAAPPPPLRRYRGRDWERYQEHAREYYRQPGWRHFRAGERPPVFRGEGPRGPGGPEHGPQGRGPQGYGPERPGPGHGPGGERGPAGDHGPGGPGGHGHGDEHGPGGRGNGPHGPGD
ncbi:hypothetical protein [Acidithiobacillus sp.]